MLVFFMILGWWGISLLCTFNTFAALEAARRDNRARPYDEDLDSLIGIFGFCGFGLLISLIHLASFICTKFNFSARADNIFDKWINFYRQKKPKKSVDDLTIEELELLVKQKKGK